MRRVLLLIIMTVIAPSVTAALGAEPMRLGASSPTAMSPAYRFEVTGPVQSHAGTSVVSIRLVQVTDNKLVTGAIVFQSRADMSPVGMAGMTAPIKSLGERPPGTYRFEVKNGGVWKKPDNWSLSFSAKVQGVAQTVTGSVTLKLTP